VWLRHSYSKTLRPVAVVPVVFVKLDMLAQYAQSFRFLAPSFSPFQ
jgi:hypothetical protein